jgi:hypothetical protein
VESKLATAPQPLDSELSPVKDGPTDLQQCKLGGPQHYPTKSFLDILCGASEGFNLASYRRNLQRSWRDKGAHLSAAWKHFQTWLNEQRPPVSLLTITGPVFQRYILHCQDTRVLFRTFSSTLTTVHHVIRHCGLNNFTHKQFCYLLISAYKKTHVQKPRYSDFWKISEVTDYLRAHYVDTDALSEDLLRTKTTFLLKLIFLGRSADLYAIAFDYIVASDTQITLRFYQRKGNQQFQYSNLHTMNAYAEDEALCPVKALNAYLAMAQHRCALCPALKGINRLFLDLWFNKCLTQQRIAKLMPKAGIDTTIFKSHSVRSAMVDKLAAGKVPIDRIMTLGNWKNTNCFMKYYHRSIDDNERSTTILQGL